MEGRATPGEAPCPYRAGSTPAGEGSALSGTAKARAYAVSSKARMAVTQARPQVQCVGLAPEELWAKTLKRKHDFQETCGLDQVGLTA